MCVNPTITLYVLKFTVTYVNDDSNKTAKTTSVCLSPIFKFCILFFLRFWKFYQNKWEHNISHQSLSEYNLQINVFFQLRKIFYDLIYLIINSLPSVLVSPPGILIVFMLGLLDVFEGKSLIFSLMVSFWQISSIFFFQAT